MFVGLNMSCGSNVGGECLVDWCSSRRREGGLSAAEKFRMGLSEAVVMGVP